MLERIDALRWAWIALISAGCTTLAGLDEDYVPVGASGTSGTRSNAGGTTGGFAGADGSGGVLGSGTGGALGTDGSGGNGGGGAGAVGGAGGSGGTPTCPSNQKFCNEQCSDQTPANGCGSSSCEPCPTPDIEHVEVWCNTAQTPSGCQLRCAPGYVPDSGLCVLEGTMGSGGTGAGGSGGSGGGAGGNTGGSGATGGSGGTGASGGSGGSSGTGGSGGRCSPNTCPPCPLLDGRIPCCNSSGKCGCGYPVVSSFYCI